MNLRVVAFYVLSFFASSSYAEVEVGDLYSPELFAEAKSQILLMDMDELDELRHYLSSCGTNNGGDIKRFFCEQAARSYSLKYGQNKAVEELILSMATVEFLIDMVDAADKAGQAQEELKMRVFKDLDRYIVIKQMMEDATRKRYKKLLN